MEPGELPSPSHGIESKWKLTARGSTYWYQYSKSKKHMLAGELNLVKLCKLFMRQIYRHCV